MIRKSVYLRTASILIFSITLFSGCRGRQQEPADTLKSTSVLSVEEVIRNLSPDTTVYTVQGVVRTANPRTHLVTLVDEQEYKQCGLNDCCVYLPVRWSGAPPVTKGLVTVKGTIQATDSGLVFMANELHIDGMTGN